MAKRSGVAVPPTIRGVNIGVSPESSSFARKQLLTRIYRRLVAHGAMVGGLPGATRRGQCANAFLHGAYFRTAFDPFIGSHQIYTILGGSMSGACATSSVKRLACEHFSGTGGAFVLQRRRCDPLS